MYFCRTMHFGNTPTALKRHHECYDNAGPRSALHCDYGCEGDSNEHGRPHTSAINHSDECPQCWGGRLVSTVWTFFISKTVISGKQRETTATRVGMNSGDNPPNTRLAIRCHANVFGILGYGYTLIIHWKMKHGALCISGARAAAAADATPSLRLSVSEISVCCFVPSESSLKYQCVESWSVSLLGFVLWI